jgi:glycolate oxidase iron-sulfur subunit
MAASEMVVAGREGPRLLDLDHCVRCGLCLNACPTYRELGWEMDSPRGRIYQMLQVAEGKMEATPAYVEHIDLCLACRACETACPSGVQYGRLVEDARAAIEAHRKRPFPVRWLRSFVFRRLIPSRLGLGLAGGMLYLYQGSGLQKLLRLTRLLGLFGKLRQVESLLPSAEAPFFFRHIGKVFPAEGERRYRVAFLAGCIANVCFARLNEATVRVLQKNGCEVAIPEEQTCCGALHLHAGLREEARALARKNIDAALGGNFDAIVTNAAGCGSTLKEYDELLADDPAWHDKAKQFKSLLRDITEFLAQIELRPATTEVKAVVTYQDSCHLAHGQLVRIPPRQLLAGIPGLEFRELPFTDLCCGSAGIYNIVQNDMAMALLEKKMRCVNATGASLVATANPGCLLQLQAGVRLWGKDQKVRHVVQILDEAYGHREDRR